MPAHQRRRAPWWRVFGPGIVSGASENDPTTVASVAVIGASTGYSLGWLALLVAPMLAVVQAIAAQVGTSTRKDLQTVVNERFGRTVALLLLVPVVLVNVLTLAADLEGGTAALNLLTGVDARWFAVPLAGVVAWLLIGGKFKRVQSILQYVPLVFLAYAVAAVMARPDWAAVAMGSFVPRMRFDTAHVSGAIALLGTTLTAYAYVWETVEASEERAPARMLPLVQWDAAVGVVVAVASFWFILVATAATLGVHHHQVQTAQDAARALEPFAGTYAVAIFAVGLLGSALLALPVIAATVGYVVEAMFGKRGNLNAPMRKAPRFYAVTLAALAAAALAAMGGIGAIKLLFVSSIAGGLATPISLAILLCVAGSPRAMGGRTVARWMLAGGWIVAAVVAAASVAFLVSLT